MSHTCMCILTGDYVSKTLVKRSKYYREISVVCFSVQFEKKLC